MVNGLDPAGTPGGLFRGGGGASGGGRRGSRTTHGGRPAWTPTNARAQMGSGRVSGFPAAASARLRASSSLRAPPDQASGLRKGECEGAPVHHAHQKKRRRLVVVTE